MNIKLIQATGTQTGGKALPANTAPESLPVNFSQLLQGISSGPLNQAPVSGAGMAEQKSSDKSSSKDAHKDGDALSKDLPGQYLPDAAASLANNIVNPVLAAQVVGAQAGQVIGHPSPASLNSGLGALNVKVDAQAGGRAQSDQIESTSQQAPSGAMQQVAAKEVVTPSAFDLGAAKIAADGNKLPVGASDSAAGSQGMNMAAMHALIPITQEASGDLTSKGAAVNLQVAPPVGADGWADAMGQKVMWLTNNQTHEATLQLNPPDLGPVNVHLTISNDQVAAQFISPHAGVREALEASLPRLREMMADSGMSLGQTFVGSDSFAGQQQFQQSQGRQAPFQEGQQAQFSLFSNDGAPAQVKTSYIRPRGSVDAFV